MSTRSYEPARGDRETMTCFDSYAQDYRKNLNRGISVSGENAEFFAAGRVAWVGQCLAERNFAVRHVLDFGCGTGAATPLFFDILGAQSVVGVDVSENSLRVARQACQHLPATFQRIDEYRPSGEIDLAFCNGVFHHIPPRDRPEAARYIADALQSDGVFAMWENNPWSPAARYVMSRIPFDRDAEMVWPGAARNLLCRAGLVVTRTDYAFIFPRRLAFLRIVEPRLRWLPLGAQYQILASKSESMASIQT